jgi:hypothetical protein
MSAYLGVVFFSMQKNMQKYEIFLKYIIYQKYSFISHIANTISFNTMGR